MGRRPSWKKNTAARGSGNQDRDQDSSQARVPRQNDPGNTATASGSRGVEKLMILAEQALAQHEATTNAGRATSGLPPAIDTSYGPASPGLASPIAFDRLRGVFYNSVTGAVADSSDTPRAVPSTPFRVLNQPLHWQVPLSDPSSSMQATSSPYAQQDGWPPAVLDYVSPLFADASADAADLHLFGYQQTDLPLSPFPDPVYPFLQSPAGEQSEFPHVQMDSAFMPMEMGSETFIPSDITEESEIYGPDGQLMYVDPQWLHLPGPPPPAGSSMWMPPPPPQ